MPRHPWADFVMDKYREVSILAIQRDMGWTTPAGGLSVESRLVLRAGLQHAIGIPDDLAGVWHPNRSIARVIRVSVYGGPAQKKTVISGFLVHALDCVQVVVFARQQAMAR